MNVHDFSFSGLLCCRLKMKYDRVGLRDYVEMLALYKETETIVCSAQSNDVVAGAN